MKIGEMTGRQILEAIARALEESGRPFEREADAWADARTKTAEVAEQAAVFDRGS